MLTRIVPDVFNGTDVSRAHLVNWEYRAHLVYWEYSPSILVLENAATQKHVAVTGKALPCDFGKVPWVSSCSVLRVFLYGGVVGIGNGVCERP